MWVQMIFFKNGLILKRLVYIMLY